VKPNANHLVLLACIAELDSLRYTPAGLPALNLQLQHESEIVEAGQTRQFKGFLATPGKGKHVVFHIQEFQQD
jgi:primosomal replication protein N